MGYLIYFIYITPLYQKLSPGNQPISYIVVYFKSLLVKLFKNIKLFTKFFKFSFKIKFIISF